jgi:hypothetical protein
VASVGVACSFVTLQGRKRFGATPGPLVLLVLQRTRFCRHNLDMLESSCMVRPVVRGKRRGPRLPAHLVQPKEEVSGMRADHEPRTSGASIQEVSGRQSSCSSHPSVDLNSEGMEEADMVHLSRVTHSPLMRSAIVQGSAPVSRVKNKSSETTIPLIHPVLGLFHPAPTSSLRAPGRLTTTQPVRQPLQQNEHKDICNSFQSFCRGRMGSPGRSERLTHPRHSLESMQPRHARNCHPALQADESRCSRLQGKKQHLIEPGASSCPKSVPSQVYTISHSPAWHAMGRSCLFFS